MALYISWGVGRFGGGYLGFPWIVWSIFCMLYSYMWFHDFYDWSYFMLFCCFIDSFWRIYCALQFGKDLFLPFLRIQTYQSPNEATRSDLNFQLPRRAKASTKLLPAHPHFATRKVRRVIWMWVKSLLLVKHVSRAPQWFFIAHTDSYDNFEARPGMG